VAGSCGRESGFSFLELLLVMTIIAFITVLAAPALSNFEDKLLLETAAGRLAAHMRLAQQVAVTGGKTTRVELYLARDYYSMFLPEQKEIVPLPVGIELAYLSFPGAESQGGYSLGFTRTGAPSSGGTVVLKNRRGEKRYVIVAVGTGRVRVSPSPPEHWQSFSLLSRRGSC